MLALPDVGFAREHAAAHQFRGRAVVAFRVARGRPAVVQASSSQPSLYRAVAHSLCHQCYAATFTVAPRHDALRERAYAKRYRSSRARAGALGPFLTSYHTAHDRKVQISRLSA